MISENINLDLSFLDDWEFELSPVNDQDLDWSFLDELDLGFSAQSARIEQRPIPGFPGYLATSDGRIISLPKRQKRRQIHDMKPWRETNRSGHLKIAVLIDGQQMTVRVHRLVALAFHGVPDPAHNVCRHLDGNPTNNVPSNLAWGTHQDNADDRKRHAIERGTQPTARSRAEWSEKIKAALKKAGSFGKAHGEKSREGRRRAERRRLDRWVIETGDNIHWMETSSNASPVYPSSVKQ